jgi:hypothetical protein
MKLTMRFDGLEASTLLVLETELKKYNAQIYTINGNTTIIVNVNQKQYAEVLVFASCFGPSELTLHQ